mgnify:CR=1 FL=1
MSKVSQQGSSSRVALPRAEKSGGGMGRGAAEAWVGRHNHVGSWRRVHRQVPVSVAPRPFATTKPQPSMQNHMRERGAAAPTHVTCSLPPDQLTHVRVCILGACVLRSGAAMRWPASCGSSRSRYEQPTGNGGGGDTMGCRFSRHFGQGRLKAAHCRGARPSQAPILHIPSIPDPPQPNPKPTSKPKTSHPPRLRRRTSPCPAAPCWTTARA